MSILPEEMKSIILSKTAVEDLHSLCISMNISDDTILDEIRRINPSFSIRPILVNALVKERRLQNIHPVAKQLHKTGASCNEFFGKMLISIVESPENMSLIQDIFGTDIVSITRYGELLIDVYTGPDHIVKDMGKFIADMKLLKNHA